MRSLAITALLAVGALLVGCAAGSVGPTGPVPESSQGLAELNTRLGIGYMREGKYELAWKRLHKALQEDPRFSTAHNAMGLLYEQLNDPAKAEEHFKLAVRYNPVDSAAQINYGSLLCRTGRSEEGEQRFLTALKNSLYETPQVAYTNAGLCMKNAGKLQRAETYFRSALQIDPRIPVALLNMSEISLAEERYLAARGYLQRYLEVGRHSPRTLWLGIRIERRLGDKNAVASYSLLLKSNYPDSDQTRLLLESEAL